MSDPDRYYPADEDRPDYEPPDPEPGEDDVPPAWAEPNERVCPVCGGEVEWLGALGRLDWFRCRACGVEVSKDKEGWS